MILGLRGRTWFLSAVVMPMPYGIRWLSKGIQGFAFPRRVVGKCGHAPCHVGDLSCIRFGPCGAHTEPMRKPCGIPRMRTQKHTLTHTHIYTTTHTTNTEAEMRINAHIDTRTQTLPHTPPQSHILARNPKHTCTHKHTH
jgi:hypothetical protein